MTLPSRRVIAFKVPHVENKGLAETPRAPNFEDEAKQRGRVKVVVGVLYRLFYETKWEWTPCGCKPGSSSWHRTRPQCSASQPPRNSYLDTTLASYLRGHTPHLSNTLNAGASQTQGGARKAYVPHVASGRQMTGRRAQLVLLKGLDAVLQKLASGTVRCTHSAR